MARQLDQTESVAILRHYEIDVAAGHSQAGSTMVVTGGPTPGDEQAITATIGAHSAQRISPITDFEAEGLIDELGDPHLKGKQLGRAVAHLIVKLSRMQVESLLVAFSLSVLIEGDHYEVLPKTVAIRASHRTTIPHRLTRHAHDRKMADR